jgi:hypothetical protein
LKLNAIKLEFKVEVDRRRSRLDKEQTGRRSRLRVAAYFRN